MSCFCDFCRKSQKPISTIFEWCQITIYGCIDNPESSMRLLQKSQTMLLLFCDTIIMWKAGTSGSWLYAIHLNPFYLTTTGYTHRITCISNIVIFLHDKLCNDLSFYISYQLPTYHITWTYYNFYVRICLGYYHFTATVHLR